MATIRIGISGWRYEPWRGLFYPADLPQRSELEYASRVLPIIEINGSFYSLQRPESYARWYAETPPGFVFSIKGPRYITHMRRLREIEEPIANFLASGILNLREKLGPILWQLPPTFKYDRQRLESFLDLLPRDTQAASRVGCKHSAWMKGRTGLAVDEQRELRHAIEIRHDSFLDPSFIELLRDRNVALVIAETARRWPMTHDITADFVYMRLHGDKELYRSGYGDKALERWAARIRAWSSGEEPEDAQKVVNKAAPTAEARDVYCFFDNTDVKLRAPFDAQTLMRKLGLTPGSPSRAGRRRASPKTEAPGTAGPGAQTQIRASEELRAKAKPRASVKRRAAAKARAAAKPDGSVKPRVSARAASKPRPVIKAPTTAATPSKPKASGNTKASSKLETRPKAAPRRRAGPPSRPRA